MIVSKIRRFGVVLCLALALVAAMLLTGAPGAVALEMCGLFAAGGLAVAVGV